ncbi:zinc ribbon domain-containing protein [Pseudomonas aeruginosa]|uniref:zinc ribbon domain-containing protein n=1 Tax=Pseudomonas aeruginosa TaxID=287 RepID=UPI000F81F929|nr:zinc ribbon domain-containing protein [Pseudomonas aeruginosa]RTS82225.1 zinc ribbon domain-containing protein [Pseudomonas aeruginosa]
MSSTQHQLIEQCTIRLRGIVDALDNIHDTSPHRWSTDLDDVHSSAESLLAMIKDQAPARSETSFEEWLANELEGEDGQPVPAAVCDITLARRAFNRWPKLEQPAKVGGVRFSAGVSSRLVVEAAQRLYEFESTPEQEAERIERLQAFREQLDPLNLAPHAKAFNEAPAEALKSEQAEAELEKQEPVGEVRESGGTLTAVIVRHSYATKLPVGTKLYAAPVAQAQHSAGYAEARQCVNCRHIGINDAADYAACHDCRWTGPEPDEDKCPGCGSENCMAAACPECGGRYELMAEANIAAVPAQAQHSVPDEDTILQIFADNAEHSERGDEHGYCIVREQHALKIARELFGAAPGNSVPQAWLDVQAERRRQIEAEGWTPEHDDEHDTGALASAAGCYAMFSLAYPAGDPSHFWPWDKSWWKPSPDGRRNMVKAGALILAEIERLDRVAASQGGPSDA